MTEKRIREIAEKMWKVFKGSDGGHFKRLPLSIQAAWISAARIAVNEVQGMEAMKSATKMVHGWHGKLDRSTKSCRIGPGGKRACK